MPGWGALADLLVGLVKTLALPVLSYFKGKGDVKRDQLRQRVEASEATARIRDRLRRDPEFRSRVRARFTR